VDGFVWLLGTFPDSDPVHTHLVPLAVSVLLLLAQECMVRKRQMYLEREEEKLESLKSDLESVLKTSTGAHHSLSVAREHGSRWIAQVVNTIKLGDAPFHAVKYCFPEPIKIAMGLVRSYFASASPEKLANLGIRDVFGRTALHYAMPGKEWFVELSQIRVMVNAQDCLGWSHLHLAAS